MRIGDTVFAIRHIPSGLLLHANPCGYGHTRMGVSGLYKNSTVRIFKTRDSARRALTQWLQGVHTHHWEDGFEVSTPKEPRIKEDMDVIEITLTLTNKEENICTLL